MKAALSLLALFLVLVSPSLAQERQVLHSPGEVRGLPFSSAGRVGNMLYLSGQIGNVPGTRQLADTGIAGQTRQALENIKGVLASAGSSLDRAVKCTVFLADIKDYGAMNTVYATYFPKDPRVLSMPACFSPQLLRLDPLWDPLRGDPRFERLARGKT